MTKDKRIKRCTDTTCEMYINKYKYSANEQVCSLCGSQLVFVCKYCFDKIEDLGLKHTVCKYCENAKEVKGVIKFKGEKLAEKAGDGVKKAGVVIADAAQDGINAVKENAPKVAKRIVNRLDRKN